MRVIDRRRLSGKQTNCRRNLGADGRAATATLNLVKTIKPSRSKIVDEAPLLLDGLSPLQQRLVSRPSSRERIGDRGNGYFIHPPRLVAIRRNRPEVRLGPPHPAGGHAAGAALSVAKPATPAAPDARPESRVGRAGSQRAAVDRRRIEKPRGRTGTEVARSARARRDTRTRRAPSSQALEYARVASVRMRAASARAPSRSRPATRSRIVR